VCITKLYSVTGCQEKWRASVRLIRPQAGVVVLVGGERCLLIMFNRVVHMATMEFDNGVYISVGALENNKVR
jgi:hypothetical protein